MSVRKKASLPVLVLWGIALAVGLTLLLLLPEAALLSRQVLPERATDLLAAAAAGIALLLSVILVGRNSKTAPTVGGLVLLGYLLLVCAAGLCICGGAIWGEGLLRQALAAAAGTAIGIMVSLRKRPRRKKRGGR